VLESRLTFEQHADLAAGVAGARRLTVKLTEPGVRTGAFALVLAPTVVENVWVGALANDAEGHDVRIESASLRPVSSAENARDVRHETDFAPPLPPVADILDGVRSLIGIRDGAGRYLLVNTAMAEFYGAAPGAFLGKTPAQLGLTEHAIIAAEPRSGVGPTIARDVELTDATGRHRHFDIAWRRVPSEDQSARYLLEVATETRAGAAPVTGLPREPVPESRLPVRESAHPDRAGATSNAETQLELLLRNGNFVSIEWDVESDRIATGGELGRLLELAADALPETAAALARFEHPRDKARVQTELQAHLDGRTEEYYCEYRLKSATGRVRWVIASGQVRTRARDGRALSYIGTLQDVTQSLETGQELQRQLARAQEAVRVSDELTREVRQLETQIREISQREQERIGHDLHDGLGQELTGVSLLLKSLEDAIERDAPQLRSRVHSVRDMVEQSIATARSLAQGLSPVHLDRDGFAGALEQLAASSESLYGIPVRFAAQGSSRLPELPGAADLYRIAQEAVRNAARHSGASEIRIKLAVDREKLVISVEDDGSGISQAARASGGMGLKIMRYRASILGATLEIGARGGAGGTVVRCSLRHVGEDAM
jgi:signal transduction histidine kinase